MKSVNLVTEDRHYTYLQEVIQVIANTIFIVSDITVIRSVTETCSYWLVDIDEIRCLQKTDKS